MSSPDPRRDATHVDDPSALSQIVLPAQELFRGSKEIRIEHDGVVYRLRITRRNRLILQK